MAEVGKKGSGSNKVFPDLVLPVSDSLDIRFPNTAEYQEAKKTFEKDGYVFESDPKTGELFAKKRIIVKGDGT
ncbi:MAG: hypothetical protein Q8L28_01190 [bacterium]|nr:hypothetical protein [bacterium]